MTNEEFVILLNRFLSNLDDGHTTRTKVGDYIFDSFGNFDANWTLEQRKKSMENGYNGFGAEYVKKQNT